MGHTVTITSQNQNYAISPKRLNPFCSFLSCRILISLGAICEKMTGVELVTAENKSEENLLKIGVV